MIAFLEDQPAAARDAIMDLLNREAVQMAVMASFDFADGAVRLCNRNVPFVDNQWGHTWGAGGGLLVGLPEVAAAEGELAPFREYYLGMPFDWIEAETWRADMIAMIADKANYASRECGLYGQIFDPDTGQPVGYPFALEVGLMDRMSLSIGPDAAMLTLTSEGLLARKGVPVYGMQTYQDQKRRHPTDEGLQFVTESGKLITWTDW